MAFEILHAIRGDSKSNGSMAIKLDMAKAYDLVEWSFLQGVMLKLGFRSRGVELVMRCVKSASFISGQWLA